MCDNGSSAQPKYIIKTINDKRVHWIEGGRGGRSAIPRNTGINKSQGEWLVFLDSDDEAA